jgi:type I restriction enzyme, R subunit
MNEEETRNRLIRPSIVQAGWADHQIREEYPYTMGRIHVSGRVAKRGEKKKVDFLLEYRQNLPLAIIEAKSSQKDLGTGMQQALGYAAALDVPFVFSANGEGFLFHDRTGLSENIETEISSENFPSPEDLYNRYLIWKGENAAVKNVIETPLYSDNPNKSPRYFQRIAIDRAVEAVARGERRVLLVMATGTGKTYTAGQIMWRLWKSGNAKRVLFLADRNILVDQARINDLKHFGDALTKITRQNFNDLGSLMSHEIFLSLYQAMSGKEEEDKLFKKLPKDFFDLIVIDECHRGSASENSEWREILEHFTDATHLGLTATPKETADTSTSHYFGDAIYTYSLKQGIDDGFLAPYKVMRVLLDNDVTGWRPVPGTLDDNGNVVEDRLYELRDINKTVIFPQREKIIAEKVIEYLKAVEDPYAKSIIFCRTTAHAERMRSALVNAAGERALENAKYVMRITGDDEEGKNQLDRFIDPEERYPTIVTTSQLLSTGVDAQTCKLIVLDKPIESMTEFKQIIGRGTRVREDKGKMWFTIMDFQGATKLFADPAFDGVAERVFEIDENKDIAETLDEEDLNETSIEEKVDEDTLIDAVISQGNNDDITERPPVFKLSGVPYAVVKEQIQYLGPDGKLLTQSLTDFTKKNILTHYPTLDSFFNAWQSAERRQVIIDQIDASGIPLEELQKQVGSEFDLFDLIMHVAYDKKMMKKNDRIEAVRRSNYLDKYSGRAREVLEALLEKYADVTLKDIESVRVLTLEPLRSMGTDYELVSLFGGKEAYFKTVDELLDVMYNQ